MGKMACTPARSAGAIAPKTHLGHSLLRKQRPGSLDEHSSNGLLDAIVAGALSVGATLAVAIVAAGSLAKPLLGRGQARHRRASDRAFDAGYEVVRRPGSGVWMPFDHDRR